MVGRLTFATAADPVRHLFEDNGVADQELDRVGLVGGHSHGDPDQVALALQRRPAALPGDVVAPRPGLANGAVAGERDVFAVLVATPNQLGHVFVDVLGDERRERQGAIVDSRTVLDLEDRVRGGRERPDHARVPGAKGSSLDELDMSPAPPALALAPGQVLVGAGPAAALLAIAVRAYTCRLLAVGTGWGRRPFDLFVHRQLIRDRLDWRLCRTRLWHVVESAREFLTALEALARVLRGGLPDDLHDRRGDRG